MFTIPIPISTSIGEEHRRIPFHIYVHVPFYILLALTILRKFRPYLVFLPCLYALKVTCAVN